MLVKKNVRIYIPHSVGICRDCAKTAEQQDNLLVAYCDHMKCGGYMNVNSGLWTLHVAITRAMFDEALNMYRGKRPKTFTPGKLLN